MLHENGLFGVEVQAFEIDFIVKKKSFYTDQPK